MFQRLFVSFWRINTVLHSYLTEALSLAKVDNFGRSDEEALLTSKVILKNVSIALGILLYNMLRYLYLVLISPVDDCWRLVLYDITLFLDCGQKWNIFNLGACLQITYSVWRMYFKMVGNRKMATPILLYQQLLDNQKIEVFKRRQKLCFFRKHQMKVSLLVIKAVRVYTLLFSYSIPFFVLYLLYYHWRSVDYFVQFRLFYPSFPNAVLAILFLLNALSTDLFWLWMIIIDCVCSAIVVAYSLIFFISIKQANALLPLPNAEASRFKVATTFERFKRLHTLILAQVFSSNLFCGYLLTAYLACIIPINTLAVIGIFTQQFNLVTTFFHLNLTVFVYVGIFLIHLLGASFSAKIHKCAKLLLGYSVKCPLNGSASFQQLSTAQRLKLVLYGEKFLTHKKYGLTYLSHSVMSMRSFSKFVLIYLEMLIISFKLINK